MIRKVLSRDELLDIYCDTLEQTRLAVERYTDMISLALILEHQCGWPRWMAQLEAELV